jgi:hypothetical protein
MTVGNIKIMPDYFLVKINKSDQKSFRRQLSKNSPFFIPTGLIFNSRNMECGEIVQIGDRMNNIPGWESCKVGDTLIFHHTIESPINKKEKAQYFICEDELYNYYAVNEINVRGFYDGIKITPHPNFIFLKNIPAYPNSNQVEYIDERSLIITNWNESSQDIAYRSEKIKEQILSLTKSTRTPQIQFKLEELEKERMMMNRKAQKSEFLPYRVAYSNKILDDKFGVKISENTVLYCWNKACLYVSNFQDKEYTYIICLVEHIGGLIISDAA